MSFAQARGTGLYALSRVTRFQIASGSCDSSVRLPSGNS